MQIIEHQNIYLDNLLCYRRRIKRSDILKLAGYISDNLQALGLEQNGRIIFTEKENDKTDDTINTEIFIPVKGTVYECDEFQKKPTFKLINAAAIRHEGSPETLYKTERILYEFIINKGYEPVTRPYYTIVRNDVQRNTDHVIDIYIGVSSNLL